MLYKAQITTEKVEDDRILFNFINLTFIVHEFVLPTRLNNLKGTK